MTNEFVQNCKYTIGYTDDGKGKLVYTLRNDCTLENLPNLLSSLVEYWAAKHPEAYADKIVEVKVFHKGADITPVRQGWLGEFKATLAEYRNTHRRTVGSGARRRPSSASRMKAVKVYTGARGGKYYVKNGRKYYV
jgi:hypothetical protein